MCGTANNNGSAIRVAPGASLDEHLFVAIDGDLDGSLSTNLNVPVSAGTTNTNDYLYYYLPNRLGSVMGLLDATDDRYMLEFYRYTIYGEATVLPLYDTGLNQIEDTPTDLSDNNSAMLATRTGGGGDPTSGRASTFNNQYTFTGRYLDTETGLHYYRFRYYESRTGRFISRDPAETPWTNTYSYCENTPTNKLDPYGLKSEAYNQQMKRWIAMISEKWVYPHKRGGLDKIDDLCKKLSGAMDWIFRNSDGSDWFVQAEQQLHDVWVDRCQRKMSVYQERASDHIETRNTWFLGTIHVATAGATTVAPPVPMPGAVPILVPHVPKIVVAGGVAALVYLLVPGVKEWVDNSTRYLMNSIACGPGLKSCVEKRMRRFGEDSRDAGRKCLPCLDICLMEGVFPKWCQNSP